MDSSRALVFQPFHVRIWNCVYVWLSDRKNLFFLTIIFIHLIPIWLFKYFPSQDGPVHIENANIIRTYHRPDCTVLREYYIFNKHMAPNWIGHLVLIGLMYIVPALVAEKIFLSSYIILLPISIRYALRVIRPDAEFLTFMSFPFIYNFFFHMGYFNFSYSLLIFFFIVGYWFKYWDRFTLRKMATLAFLSLLLYFCHLVSLVMAYVAIALLTIWLILLDQVQFTQKVQLDIRVLWKSFRTRAILLLIVLLPTLILVEMFLLQHGITGYTSINWSFWQRLKYLSVLSVIVSYERQEFFLSIALVCLFVTISLQLLTSKVLYRRFNRGDGFLILFFVYILIYFTAPEYMSGGAEIITRLSFYPFFALILWFGAQQYSRIVKRIIVIVPIVISLIMLGVQTMKYADINDYLEEYLSGIHLIEPNTTLLPLSFLHKGPVFDRKVLSRRIMPFLHASGYIAAQKCIVELDNYEAFRDYFPIIFRPNLSPEVHIGIGYRLEAEPPQVDFLTYPERTGGHVDYVLVWGVQGHLLSNEATKSIFKQLKQGYDLIYTSPKRGLMQLYRRKDI